MAESPQRGVARRLAQAVLAAFLCFNLAAATGEEPKEKPRRIIIGQSEAKTTLFGLPGSGSKFLYVLDTSDSMTLPQGRPLATAKQEIVDSIDKLDKLCEFYVIHYNNVPRLLDMTAGRNCFGTEDNKLAAKRLIAAIPTGQRTEHEPAIIMALRMRPDVLYLMTDGDDPALERRDLERISRVNEGQAIIHAVQFGKGAPKRGADWLKQLAKENRGQYKFVNVSEAK